jgi:hypothetical protein
MYVSDIIAICALPLLFVRKEAPALLKLATPIFLFAGFWLLGAVLTDLIQQTPFKNYSRGWAKIVFFMCSFASVLIISNVQIRRLMAYFAGLAVAGLITTTFFPDMLAREAPWKFGYALPVSIFAVILASVATGPRLLRQLATPLLASLVNLALNYRSMFAMLVVTSVVSSLTAVANSLAPTKRVVSVAFTVGFFALSVAGMWAGSAFYGNLAESGTLGQAAKDKYDQQNQGNLGPLLSGRSESLGSTKAILDSPIVGHGSWAEGREYVAYRIIKLRERGVETQGNPFYSLLIPSHSYILGSWVEAGILGALFWAFCWITAIKGLLLLVDIRDPATPFAAFMLIQLVWDIPFSPFGALVRFFVAGQLCVALWAVHHKRVAPSSASTPADTSHSHLAPRRSHVR